MSSSENCSNCSNAMEKRSSPWSELDPKSPIPKKSVANKNALQPTKLCFEKGQSLSSYYNIKSTAAAIAFMNKYEKTAEWTRCPACRKVYKRVSDSFQPISEVEEDCVRD